MGMKNFPNPHTSVSHAKNQPVESARTNSFVKKIATGIGIAVAGLMFVDKPKEDEQAAAATVVNTDLGDVEISKSILKEWRTIPVDPSEDNKGDIHYCLEELDGELALRIKIPNGVKIWTLAQGARTTRDLVPLQDFIVKDATVLGEDESENCIIRLHVDAADYIDVKEVGEFVRSLYNSKTNKTHSSKVSVRNKSFGAVPFTDAIKTFIGSSDKFTFHTVPLECETILDE